MGRDRLHVELEGTLNRTITSMFLHYVVYYQWSSNEFRQFPINRWEDFCGFMDGDVTNNVIINRVYPRFKPYSNVNHTCPLRPGFYFYRMYNFTVSTLGPLALVPSGRYRLEISFHEEYKSPLLIKLNVVASISDHRIEVF